MNKRKLPDAEDSNDEPGNQPSTQSTAASPTSSPPVSATSAPTKKAKSAKPTSLPEESKLTKPSKSTSAVWKVFGLLPSVPDWAFCRKCKNWKRYANGGTDNLKSHMQKCGLDSPSPQQAQITKFTGLTSESKQKVLEKTMAEAFMFSNLPFSLNESPSFQRFIHALNPSFKIPQATHTTTLVDAAFEEKATKIAAAIKQAESVALTTDAATTVAGTSMNAVTCHWIDSEWELKSATIALKELDESHTGVYLSSVVQEDAKRFLIKDTAIAVTTDGASNALACAKDLKDSEVVDETVRCICHLLHLAVTASLDIADVSDLLSTCKSLVTKIKKSNILSQALRERQQVALAHCRELKQNPERQEAEQQRQLDQKIAELALDLGELDVRGDDRMVIDAEGKIHIDAGKNSGMLFIFLFCPVG